MNIAASSLATVLALRLLGEAGIAVAAGLLTLVILIFAEVAPKTFAALHPERVAFPAAHVLTWLLVVFQPLVIAVNWMAKRSAEPAPAVAGRRRPRCPEPRGAPHRRRRRQRPDSGAATGRCS